MTKVATRYRISANYLARVCRHLNVPFPPRGYWAKVQHGQTPARPSLPSPRAGEVLDWERGDPVPRSKVSDGAVPDQQPTWQKAHQLVAAGTRDSFEKSRLSEVGYLRPYKKNLVDVFVTREMLPQALDMATHLFRRFESSGHRVMLATSHAHRPPLRLFEGQEFDYYNSEPWAPNHATLVHFESISFGLTVFETTEYVDAVYEWDQPIRYVRATPDVMKRKSRGTTTSKKHLPSGRLALRAYLPDWRVKWEKVWVASKAGRLPFNSIVREMEADIPMLIKRREEEDVKAAKERERHEAEQRERERLELEQRRVEASRQSRQSLLDIVNRWSLAQSVEAFFADATERSRSLDSERRGVVQDRLEKARAMLGGLDALARFLDWKTPDELVQAPHS